MRRFAFWAVALSVTAIVVFNVQGWVILHRTSRILEQELGARLQAVATTLAAALGDAGRSGSSQHLPGRPDSGRPNSGSERLLNEVMQENGLFNLFVVNGELEYLVNLRNPELVAQRDPTLELDLAEIVAALSGVASQSRMYRAGGYFLKSAYAPLEDSSGTIGAVLGVEADATFFSVLSGFRNSLLVINGLSLLAIAAIVLVSLSLARHAIGVERAASRANSLALMGQMSAALAHEIRNPLGIIRAAAERLKARYAKDTGEKVASHVDPAFDYIQDEVDRLAAVVSNYLGLGRFRAGEVESLDLGEVIAGVVADLKDQAQRNGVELEYAERDLGFKGSRVLVEGAKAPRVTGNRNELRQAFLNIILNGIQAQPGGGKVQVQSSVDKRRGRDWVVIEVRDNGPGIKAKDRRRVFEPFFTTKEKGSGLGLFVVRRVLEGHGGRVEIRNQRPETRNQKPETRSGTVVEVRLPV